MKNNNRFTEVKIDNLKIRVQEYSDELNYLNEDKEDDLKRIGEVYNIINETKKKIKILDNYNILDMDYILNNLKK